MDADAEAAQLRGVVGRLQGALQQQRQDAASALCLVRHANAANAWGGAGDTPQQQARARGDSSWPIRTAAAAASTSPAGSDGGRPKHALRSWLAHTASMQQRQQHEEQPQCTYAAGATTASEVAAAAAGLRGRCHRLPSPSELASSGSAGRRVLPMRLLAAPPHMRMRSSTAGGGTGAEAAAADAPGGGAAGDGSQPPTARERYAALVAQADAALARLAACRQQPGGSSDVGGGGGGGGGMGWAAVGDAAGEGDAAGVGASSSSSKLGLGGLRAELDAEIAALQAASARLAAGAPLPAAVL